MVGKELTFGPGDITYISVICKKCGHARIFDTKSLPSSLEQKCAVADCSGSVQHVGERDAMQAFKLLLQFEGTVRFRIEDRS